MTRKQAGLFRSIVLFVFLLLGTLSAAGVGAAGIPGDPLQKVDPLLKSFMRLQGIDTGARQATASKSGFRTAKKPLKAPPALPAKRTRVGLSDQIAHRRGADGTEVVPVLIQLREGATPAALTIPGLQVRSVMGSLLTAELPASQIAALAALGDVLSVTGSHKVIRTNDVSIPDISADLVQGELHTTGKGALVGVADTGVDWRHGDFIGPDGKSRILYIWDQTDSTGPPPAGYNYGTEYTKAQIDADLAGASNVAEKDNDPNGYGHGTHVLGTAAGNGRATGQYKGVAPEAGILFVKLNWDLAATVDSNAYMIQKAAALGKPIAINNSWGDRSGPKDGSDPYCKAFDALAGPGKPGKVICFAAGNDGSSPYHVTGTLAPGASGNYLLQSTGESDALSSEIWFPTSGRFTTSLGFLSDMNTMEYAQITCPPGQRVQYTVNSNDTPYSPFIGAVVEIDATQTPYSANPALNEVVVSFDLSSMSQDDLLWATIYLLYLPLEVNLNNTGTTLASFDGFGVNSATISTDNSGQSFLGDTNKTLLEPGVASNVISAAAYVTKTVWYDQDGARNSVPFTQVQSIAPFSSRGPTRDGGHKPDIAAPGEVIVSSLSADCTPEAPSVIVAGGKHQAMQGTSMACPHVTGAAALLLSVNPQLDAAQVKQILTSTARSDSYTGDGWNATWGSGKLDVRTAVERVTRPFATTANYVKPGWNLIALPGDPVNPDPIAVLSGINVPGSSFQYWRNDLEQGGYQLYGEFFGWTGPMEVGTPYWFLHESGSAAISFTGRPRLADQTLVIPAHTAALHWAMIGQPFDHSTPCSSITFSTPTVPSKSWSDAYNAGLVESTAIGYDSSTARFVIAGPPTTFAERSSLEPWYGYWLLVRTANELTIHLPAAP